MIAAIELLASALGTLRRMGVTLVLTGLAVLALVAAGSSSAHPAPATPGLELVGSSVAAR
jgi:hypothetical protein